MCIRDRYNAFESVEFDEHNVSFFSEYGGNYGVTLARKIESLKAYPEISVLFNFEAINNCEIERVVYFTSKDGRKWDRVIDYSGGILTDQNNRAIHLSNDSLNLSYVRAVAHTNFSNNGKLSCNYVKIEGEGKKEPSIEPLSIIEDHIENEFFIFSFEHTLNIETGIELPYEVLITSITGQIVYCDQFEGSTSIILPQDLKGIYVVSIIHNNAFQATKKVVFE